MQTVFLAPDLAFTVQLVGKSTSTLVVNTNIEIKLLLASAALHIGLISAAVLCLVAFLPRKRIWGRSKAPFLNSGL